MSLLDDARFYVRFLRDPVDCLIRLDRDPGAKREFVRKGREVVFLLGARANEAILGDPDTFHVLPITLPGPEGSAQRRIGEGLVNINGPIHRRHRSVLVPPLAGSQLDAYYEPVRAIVDAMLDGWRPGERRDLLEEMNRLAVRVSSATLFAMDDAAEAERVAGTIDRWFKMNTATCVRLFQRAWPGTPYARMLREAARVEGTMRTLVARRRAEGGGGADILSRLLQARDDEGRPLADDELVGELTIAFVASHETTSKALAWTLFLLAQHPDVARSVVAEIDDVIGGGAPEASDLARLPRLDRVLKESLRILPPVAFNVRRASRDTSVLGRALPTGSTVVFSHYLAHHDAALYPEPERFRPDRWLDLKPSQYEYLPFSAGPRRCIGEGFTTRVQKLVLIRLLQRFRFTIVPNSRFDRHQAVTVAPSAGVPVVLHPPDGAFERVPVTGSVHQMVTLD